jgi:hypothetical protein
MSGGSYSIDVSSKAAILSKIDGAMWHPTVNFVKEHSIAGRFLVIPVTLETFATELLDFPVTSLFSALTAFKIILGSSEPDPHLGKTLSAIACAGSAALYAIATIFSPIYALVKAAAIFVKFIQDPLEVSQREAFKSDMRTYPNKWSISTRTKQITFKFPDGSSQRYLFPNTKSGPTIIML